MPAAFSRRRALQLGGSLVGSASLVSRSAVGAEPDRKPARNSAEAARPFRYCLNTSTIRGQKLALPRQIEIAAEAGYNAIEPWLDEMRQFDEGSGSLADLAKKIRDLGLTVESAIGFADWIVDDDQRRAQGLEQARRDMELVARLGGTRIAAPPAGATDQPGLDLSAAAERYHALLEVGRQVGVTPQVEVWGFSKNLSRLAETVFVAVASSHPDACLLLDAYHLYKGGSDFAGLRLLSGQSMHVFHVNDYPATPDRASISDAHRVYPGDGVAPLTQVCQDLHENGFRGVLSLELFNPDYWKQDPLVVARTGLEKMRRVVAEAMSAT